jgi:hypothetical protein
VHLTPTLRFFDAHCPKASTVEFGVRRNCRSSIHIICTAETIDASSTHRCGAARHQVQPGSAQSGIGGRLEF